VRPRRTKEAIQSRLEAQVMAEYEAEKAVEREEWVTGGRMPTTYRDFIGPRLPTFLETLPLSMSEEEYNAAMDALAAGTITPEQEASLAEDAADHQAADDDHWADYNLRRWGNRRGPRGAPE
jgi:hypothetical protein